MINFFRLTIIIQICVSLSAIHAQKAKITGFVLDDETQNPVPDVNITIENTTYGTATRSNGFYEINTLPFGEYSVKVHAVGYQTALKKIIFLENCLLNFNLKSEPVQMDRIIITATRCSHLQSRVTISTEVIPVSISRGITGGEQLRSVPGLFIKSNGGLAGASTPTLRGASDEQVLIMLDGVRLNTAQGTPLSLNDISASALESIEIIRGGHSSLFGSNAMGGVINMVSKESLGLKNMSYGLQSTLGSYGTKIHSGFGGQRIGPWEVFLSYHKSQSDGNFKYIHPDTRVRERRKNNDYLSRESYFKTFYNFSRLHQIQLIFQNLDSEMGSPGSLYFDPSNARLINNRTLLSIHYKNQVLPSFFLSAQCSWHRIDRRYDDPNPPWETHDRHQNEALGLDFQVQYNASSNITMIAGTEDHEDAVETTKYASRSRSTRSVYLQLETNKNFRFFRTLWTVRTAPSVRWDKYSDIGFHTSPKMGILLSAGEKLQWTLRGNIGRSFRAPSFDHMYWNDPGMIGYPEIRPETGTNTDVGLMIQSKQWLRIKYEISFFENDIKDKIDWADIGNWVFQARNVSNSKLKGIENNLQIASPDNFIYGNIGYSWIKSIDQESQKYLPYNPVNQANFELGLNYRILHTDINCMAVGKRYTNVDNSVHMPAYLLFNINSGVHFSVKQMKVLTHLQVINLGDKSVSIMNGYPIPGREYRLTIGLEY